MNKYRNTFVACVKVYILKKTSNIYLLDFRINSHTSNQFVDPVLPNIDIEDFKRQFSQNSQLTKEDNFCVNNKDLQKLQEDEEKDCTSLDSVDSGITLNIDNQKNESESTIENDASNIVNKQNTLDAVKTDNNQTNSPVNTNPAANQGLTKVLTRQHIEQSPVNVQKSRKDSRNSEIRVGESLESLDNESGILHVWFLMIDGLAGSVACCPKTYQPETLDMLFDLLRSLHDIPGIISLIFNVQTNFQNFILWISYILSFPTVIQKVTYFMLLR